MSDSQTPLPPAGWYADPENPAGERWWNGVAWGEERRAKDAVPPIPPAPVAAEPIVVPAAAEAPVTAVSAESVAATPTVAEPAVAEPAAAEWVAAAPVVAAPAAAPVAPVVAPTEERPNPYASAAPYGTTTPSYAYAPSAYAPSAPSGNPVALVGFIIALASIVLNFILTGLVGIAGGIVSAIGLARANRLAQQGITPNGKGLAIAGTIIGFVGGGLSIIGFFAIMAFYLSFGGY
jgi:hypothetical protein